jgi:hypothetical protein
MALNVNQKTIAYPNDSQIRRNGLLLLINYYYGLVTRVKIRPYGFESISKEGQISYHKGLQRRPYGILLLISYKHYGLATGIK